MFAIASAAQQSNAQLPSVIVQTVVERDATPQFRDIGRVVLIDTVSVRAGVPGILERRIFIQGDGR